MFQEFLYWYKKKAVNVYELFFLFKINIEKTDVGYLLVLYCTVIKKHRITAASLITIIECVIRWFNNNIHFIKINK